jgi:5-methylcytosine-specific restriction endonuclease McrA
LIGTFHRKKDIWVLLERFWRKLPQDAEGRLALLKKYAEIQIKHGRRKRLRRRKAFDRQRETMWRDLCHNCLVCGKPAAHRHHIIPIEHGGPNSLKNIAPLSLDCHQAIHAWLKTKNEKRKSEWENKNETSNKQQIIPSSKAGATAPASR